LVKIKFYLSKLPPKDAKKKIFGENSFYIVDIQKIIRDLGYEYPDISPEAEFVINITIRKKITQGIYNCKGDGILICNRFMSDFFDDSLSTFIETLNLDSEYTIEWI
jgi:hypothetical protein